MYYIHHFIPNTPLYDVPEIQYVDGIAMVQPKNLVDWISTVSLEYDIMFVRNENDFQTMSIILDDEGKRFRQR